VKYGISNLTLMGAFQESFSSTSTDGKPKWARMRYSLDPLNWDGETHIHIHTYIHTHTHTYTHTYIHTYIHTYTHTHIHTYTHNNMRLFVIMILY
jgi:hypothetical protein